MHDKSRLARSFALALALACASVTAFAQDTLKFAVGQRGNWDTSVTEIGQRAGIFKKHGLVVEIVYTQGSGETQQAVISGSVDIGASIGMMGTLSAFSKGAPVRIIGAEMTGSPDLFWYVRGDSPIKSFKDVTDKHTIAYSTTGASTHGIALAFVKQYDLKAKPVATGNPPSTLTMVMSGQIDVGWAAPPFGLDLLDQGRIRILGSGNDTVFKDQTVRLIVTTAPTLQAKKAQIERFLKAYRETIDFMYDNPQALKIYAEWLNISDALAKRSRDDFFPRASLNPDRIIGLDIIVKDAVALKFTATEMTKEQLTELIQIPPRTP
jgi:NitT/TauT family transport system substrate-binding protein